MMKHYLGLIPRSAKVRRRQNHMTILCIVLAVSLVTAIFSVAQQMVYLQSERMQDKHGSWHLQISGISQETAAEIAAQAEVVSVGSVALCNADGALPYRLDSGSDNKRVALYGIGAALRYGIGGEFAATPVFSFSLVGLVSGAVVGVVTVLLAAESPARRAARISPVAAVSGQGQERGALRPMRTRRLQKVEWALGIHHAVAGRKNWFLMTASFALTIVLAFCFSVLLDSTAEEETVLQIARLVEDDVIVNDLREQNQKDASTYWASRLVAYGFLGILGLISLCSIVNSISMSVSARTKQYGILRAIGMDRRQLTRMIAAEAGTYAVSGLVVGCVAGLFLSRALYARLITHYFGMAWHLSGVALGLLALFVIAAAAVAVYAPAKRICALSVTETIQAL